MRFVGNQAGDVKPRQGRYPAGTRRTAVNKNLPLAVIAFVALTFLVDPASAHHLMGGKTPATFGEGLLSGLGHPVIGLDHFAAVVAVGCLAAAHRAGPVLAVAFVVAMIAGVAAHVRGTTVPAAEIL